MARALAALACLALLLAPPAASWHEGHRHWSTIPDGPYALAAPQLREMIASDGTPISYAVHLPVVPAGTRVPVILTAGPYFGLTEEPVDQPSSSRFSGFLLDNFVSHGYAVVAANVRGTGLSGGCMELMSLREAQDLDELVTLLANEPWSTGAVAMAGKSYDGGTPWMVAQFGNPALKTIVPLQGVTDVGDLLFHRGAAQFRAPIFHSVVYSPFGFGVDGGGNDPGYRPVEKRAGNLGCPELAEGQAAALYATYTGDTTEAPILTDYWRERAWREPTLQKYRGSAFIVHGLQDWNVIPSQVAPFFNDLQIPKKLLLGQWAHDYPDQGAFTNRPDFAAVLKAWFDRELKGLPVDTGPVVEVADARTGAWRSTTQWPEPLPTRTWHMSAGNVLVESDPAPFQKPFASPAGVSAAAIASPCTYGASGTRFQTTLTEGFTLSGIGTVQVRLDPPTPGILTVSVCDGNRLIAHGGAHTLHPQGKELGLWTPGAPLDVRVDLEPAERSVPAGSRLSVSVRFEGGQEAGQSYWPATGPGAAVLVAGSLELPVR